MNDSLFKALFHVGLIRRRLLYAKLIKEVFSGCNGILDVGCGSGLFISVCKGYGKLVIGVDVDCRQLHIAKGCSYGSLVLADAYHLPLKDSCMDGVFFSHVIEHLQNPFPVLTEIQRVLKNGGVLVVITPTEHRYFYTPGHVYAYTKEALGEALSRAGFLNVHVIYGHSFLLNIKDSEFLRRIINIMPIRWFKEILIARAVNRKV